MLEAFWKWLVGKWEKKTTYQERLVKAVTSQYFQTVDKAFSFLNKNYGCTEYKILENKDVEFYFDKNEHEPNRHKILVKNQVIFTREDINNERN